MRSFAAPELHPAIRLAGALSVQPTPRGIALSRLSAEAERETTDEVLRFTATIPSGVRVELVSDTTAIELDLFLTHVVFGHVRPARSPVDLVVDGRVVAGRLVSGGRVFHFHDAQSHDFRVEPGHRVTVRFGGLEPVAKQIEVWLPHNAAVEITALRIDEGASLAPSRPGRPRWAHYGSSISHCFEARRPTETWPAAVALRGGLDLVNLSIPGQCHLDPFAARAIRDLDVDLVSMKLGINVVNGDTMRERVFVPAVHGLLDTVRDRHPGVPIVLVTPIVCPVVEEWPGPTITGDDGRCARVEPPPRALGVLTLQRIRELLREVAQVRQADGDVNLHLLEGPDLFGMDDLDALPDGLHPNAAGHARIGERFFGYAFAPGGPFAATVDSARSCYGQ